MLYSYNIEAKKPKLPKSLKNQAEIYTKQT